MNEPEHPKKGWGCLQWGVVGVLVLLGVGMGESVFRGSIEQMHQYGSAQNARQILMAVKIWAQENGDNYPSALLHLDRRSANTVFRELFRDDILMNDMIFGAPASCFQADGVIGEPPDFSQAVQAGENHWMMVDDMTIASPEHQPLIFENALEASWPPKWQPNSAGQLVRGRTWRQDKIVVGFNDGHVDVIRLKLSGDHLTLPDQVLAPKGLSPVPTLKVLDIETDRR